MTKKQAFREFSELYPPETFRRRGGVDHPMRNEAWNNYTDHLCKDGQITAKQYHNWAGPWRN